MDFITSALIEKVVYGIIFLMFIYVVASVYTREFDPMGSMALLTIGLLMIISLLSYGRGLDENPNRIMNSYLDSLKLASYDSIENSDVHLDNSIKAKINITEIAPGQKKIEVSFNQDSRELKKETIFRLR